MSATNPLAELLEVIRECRARGVVFTDQTVMYELALLTDARQRQALALRLRGETLADIGRAMPGPDGKPTAHQCVHRLLKRGARNLATRLARLGIDRVNVQASQ